MASTFSIFLHLLIAVATRSSVRCRAAASRCLVVVGAVYHGGACGCLLLLLDHRYLLDVFQVGILGGVQGVRMVHGFITARCVLTRRCHWLRCVFRYCFFIFFFIVTCLSFLLVRLLLRFFGFLEHPISRTSRTYLYRFEFFFCCTLKASSLVKEHVSTRSHDVCFSDGRAHLRD